MSRLHYYNLHHQILWVRICLLLGELLSGMPLQQLHWERRLSCTYGCLGKNLHIEEGWLGSAGAAAAKSSQYQGLPPTPQGFPPLPLEMLGMAPVPPQTSSTVSVAFALGWGVQSVSVDLVQTSLQSLDNYLMSTLIATGTSCVSDSGHQVSIPSLVHSTQSSRSYA